MLTRHITMFVMLFIVFGLATQNLVGTLIGCIVNAVIYQWSAQYVAK
jgi:hypothetical protein